jgi:hypothetical protein
MRGRLAVSVAVTAVALGGLASCRALLRRGPPCAQRAECREAGRCGTRTFRAGDRGEACFVDRDESCRQSTACRRQGACRHDPAVDPAACVALEPADCLASSACREEGRCQLAADGTCVVSETGCQRSSACGREDRCARDGARCARSQADEPSWCVRACREEGACARLGRECRATSDGDCRAALGCREEGRCAVDLAAGVCVARAADDCRRAAACLNGTARYAPCALRGAVCADARPACARGDECLLRGDCAARDGICAPATAGHCTPSIECVVQGRCTAANHLCLARRDDDCRGSLECRAYGRCGRQRFLGMSWCVAPGERATPRPCPSAPCLAEGRCLRPPATEWCVTPQEAGLAARLPTRRPPAAAPPAPPPEPPPAAVDGSGLRALVDGRRVRLTHAVAATRGGDQAVHVVLGDGPLGCDLARGAEEPAAPRAAATVVRLVVARLLIDRPPPRAPRRALPTGKAPSLGVTHAQWPADARRGPSASYGSLAGWADATPGLGALDTLVPLTLSVAITLREQSLALAGTIPVRGCGVGPSPVPERPQPRVVFQVQGVPVPVRGALLRPAFGHQEVWLTSRPTTCALGHGVTGPPADVLARVTLEAAGAARLALEGAALPQTIGVWSPAGEARVHGEPDANGEVDVTLLFSSLRSNPPVRLEGRVRALRCR